MTTTYTNAVDEMFSVVRTVWNANTAAIVGYVPEMRWQGVEVSTPPPNDLYWGRTSIQTVTDQQTNVATLDGNGKRRYTTSGLIFVQLFAPLADAQSMDKIRKLAQTVRAGFRGTTTPSSVVFRNARINELSPDGKANRINVVAEFEYDEIT